MLYAGHRNNSRLLLLLFALWVVSPFVALIWTNMVSQRSVSTVTLILTPVSLAIYAYVALGPPRPKIAFFFLVVPAASWLLIAAARLISGRLPR